MLYAFPNKQSQDVYKRQEEEIAEARAEKLLNNRGVPSCIAVESALLAEGGLEGCCDTLWYIDVYKRQVWGCAFFCRESCLPC